MKLFRKMALAAALAGFSPTPLFACAACYGRSGDPLAHGMNWGILTLLAVLVTMLASIATFFYFLVRREAAAQEQLAAEENLSGAKI
ncbi:MAG TPA: hypothetical protein VH280_13885 [Verrucomicrobiae bacterium]|jgi:formate hydrogenlyase subunit 3/multisubunit Na+/H+ antiporter MnhD subunit|nr:hypothetical protein [Verrucomicrobiae bacterium]